MLAELVNFENIQAQTFLFNPWYYSEVRWHPEDLNGVKKNLCCFDWRTNIITFLIITAFLVLLPNSFYKPRFYDFFPHLLYLFSEQE